MKPHILGLLFLLDLVQSYIYIEHHNDWSYHGPNGTEHWCSLYPSCCGQVQSPLDFRLDEMHLSLPQQDFFLFTDYDASSQSISLQNSGHTVILKITDGTVRPKISKGLVNKTYVFDHLHFHWGNYDVTGSEHRIEGKQYALELHLVHYSDEYNNVSDAINSNSSDALEVLGVLFNIELFNNTILSVVTDNLKQIRYRDETINLKAAFKLSDVLPSDTTQFFRYSGSLTTPPCNQVVTWTVFAVPNFISRIQTARFRHVLASGREDEPPLELSDNFRPTQDVYGQRVTLYSN